jgi:hypothetical protein
MADPVKTILLKAIEDRLNDIQGLATVKRWEDIPADLTGLTMPVAFFWETEEQEVYNRLVLGRLDFWVQVFFGLDPEVPASFTAFSEAAEVIAGKISDLFATPGELRVAGLIQAQPAGQVVKARYNDDYGVLFMSYQLSYGRARGDACSLNG